MNTVSLFHLNLHIVSVSTSLLYMYGAVSPPTPRPPLPHDIQRPTSRSPVAPTYLVTKRCTHQPFFFERVQNGLISRGVEKFINMIDLHFLVKNKHYKQQTNVTTTVTRRSNTV